MKDSSSSSIRRWLNSPHKGVWPYAPTLVVICFLFLARSSDARVYIQIDQPSEKKFPIAIVDPESTDGGSKKWDKLAEIIRNDLKMTGLFDVIPESQFPSSDGAMATESSQIQFAPWTLLGVQALVNGTYESDKEGTKIELALYDPFLGQRILKKSYTAKKEEVSVVAHHFADQIIEELTGEPGVFSTRIAFVQASKKAKEICVMDMDGGNNKTLTKDKTINLSPAWSPDGSRIAYTTFTKNKNSEVALIASHSGKPRQLTSNGGINLSPAFSPSGQLTVASTGGAEDTEIYLLSASGQLTKKLAPSYGIDVNPAWSPDGSSFVFSSERGGKLHLYKADASGGNVERLTFVGSQNDNPAWSPKGDKIAFQSLSGGWNIFIMNTDGSMIQKVTSIGCESPTWAPNGRFLAATCGGRIYVMREDGSNMTEIGPSGAYQPSWGPREK